MPRPVVVATAAPATPISGNGPQPKMKQGPSAMLRMFASQSVRIAMAASPAPRKTALMRKIRNTLMLPPSITRVKPLPCAIADGDAPMSARRSVAKIAPTPPSAAATPAPRRMICTAARAAPSLSFWPMRRATTAVPAIESPMAIA
jgi:hypothetical protein